MRFILLATVAVLALAGCQFAEKRGHHPTEAQLAAAAHREFRTKEGWGNDTYRNEELIAKATAKNSRVEISINEQRGLLLVNDMIAMDFPVATGRPSYPTPPGNFKVLEKKDKYASNLYGKLFNAEGKLIDSDADTRTMIMPEGGRFVGSDMPYWMRIHGSGVGMHIGIVPGGRPASHGCIRLRRQTATTLYKIVGMGTPVTVTYGMPALGTGDAKPTPQVAPRPVKIVPRVRPPVTETPESRSAESTVTPSTDPVEKTDTSAEKPAAITAEPTAD